MNNPFFNFRGSPGADSSRPGSHFDRDAHYKTLGVERGASAKTIRASFRTKARKMHPDRGGDSEEFKVLSNAYDILSDPDKRSAYDNGRRGGGPNRRRRRTVPPTIMVKVPVSLERLYSGGSKKIQYKCNAIVGADGKPVKSDGPGVVATCKVCAGLGVVAKLVKLGPGFIQQMRHRCPKCGGSGSVLQEGFRLVRETRTEVIVLEAGCSDGEKIVRRGRGNAQPGCEPGDIVFVIQQTPDGLYARKDNDLILRIKVSLVDALCGIRMSLRHPRGKDIMLVSPKCILRPGTAYDIAGLGMPHSKSDTKCITHGRLVIIPTIRFPTVLTHSQKDAIRLAISNTKTRKDSLDDEALAKEVYHVENITSLENHNHGGENTVQCPQQ